MVSAEAATVASGRITAGNNGSGESTLFIDQEFASALPGEDPDFTGALFEFVSAHEHRFFGSFLDEGVSLFLVDEFDRFGSDSLAAGEFGDPWSHTPEDLIVDFGSALFIAFVTPSLDLSFPGEYPPAYGWAHIQSIAPSPGETPHLFVLDSAVAYDAEGIIIGTQQAIPEPSIGMLAILGLGMLASRRNRRP